MDWRVLGLLAVSAPALARDFPAFPLRQTVDHPQGLPLWTNFAESCAVEGDLAVVGATQSGAGNTLYARNGGTWTAIASLNASAPDPGTWFGHSVAIAAGRVFIGAPKDSATISEGGSVRVFEQVAGAWTQTARLESASPSVGARFGMALDARQNRVCIGAPGAHGLAPNTGRVHVFDWDGSSWVETAAPQGSDSATGDQFGASVSLNGDRLLVGAPGFDGGAPDSGQAYLLRDAGAAWTELVRFHPLAGDPPVGNFGRCVELYDQGHGAVVSERSWTQAGAAHVWSESGGSWNREARLTPPEFGPTDLFGEELAVMEDSAGLRRLFVAAPQRDELDLMCGAVYVFQATVSGWHSFGKVTADAQRSHDQFGTALAIAGDQLLVGVPGAYSFTPSGITYSGRVCVYDILERPYIGVPYCFGDGSSGNCRCGNLSPVGASSGCAKSDGVGARLVAQGTASLSIGDLRPQASGLAPGRACALIGSLASRSVAVPLGDGLLCLYGPRVNYGVQFADGAGGHAWPTVYGGPYGWSAGEVWHLQAWYRNTGYSLCGTSVNLSNALEVSLTP